MSLAKFEHRIHRATRRRNRDLRRAVLRYDHALRRWQERHRND